MGTSKIPDLNKLPANQFDQNQLLVDLNNLSVDQLENLKDEILNLIDTKQRQTNKESQGKKLEGSKKLDGSKKAELSGGGKKRRKKTKKHRKKHMKKTSGRKNINFYA